jgi:hypothetical protein
MTFPGEVTFTVTGLPTGATATITPQVLAAGASLTDVTLSIQLPKATADIRGNRLPNRTSRTILWGLLLLPFVVRRRRYTCKLQSLGTVLLALSVGVGFMAGLSGCGGASLIGQQRSSDITFTATMGAISHSTSFILNVK